MMERNTNESRALINAQYQRHTVSGRYYQSNLELRVHNYLVETETPYCSGIDPMVNLNDGTMRSDDIVIPARPSVGLPEGRIEVAGLWNNLTFGEERRDAYRERKLAVHEYWENHEREVVHIILTPSGVSNLPLSRIERYLSPYVGGGADIVAEHDILHPPQRPGSTYDTAEEMLEAIRERFPRGELTHQILVEELGESFYVRLIPFFPNQTLHTVASECGLSTRTAPRNETREQFLARVRIVMNEEFGGALPSTHVLHSSHPWMVIAYKHHFDSWSELLEELGLPPNRVTNTVTEGEIRERLISLRDELGRVPTSWDIQNLGHAAAYQWLRSHRERAGYTMVMEYARALLDS